MSSGFGLMAGVYLFGVNVHAAQVQFKQRCLHDLVEAVPGILASQDKKTGQFGTGIWIVTDQNVMLPLAVAWSFRDAANPYYHKAELLDAVMAGGDALIADADPNGMWEYRKKDGSKWGKVYMPWTYSRWVRSYLIIRDQMPEERSRKWAAALQTGYTGIAAGLAHGTIYDNIYAHNAMGLYYAGEVLNNKDWQTLAASCLKKVVNAQNPSGYWSEGRGPVVVYSPVYIDALTLYYSASGDAGVLPALERAAKFHLYFTYPDGTPVETIDERNPYHGRLPDLLNVGFSLTREGRTLLARLIRTNDGPISADSAATLLTAGTEGPGLDKDPMDSDFVYVLGNNEAALLRSGPWLAVVSGYTNPPATDKYARWWMDRQNFVSIFHDKTGLILGGGNSKLQPDWSTFSIGETRDFHFVPGSDGRPNFIPPPGLLHMPASAKPVTSGEFGVDLDYGGQPFRVRIRVISPTRMECTWSGRELGAGPVVAHATIYPRWGKPVVSAAGQSKDFDDTPLRWTGKETGGWIEHSGFRITVPENAVVHGPSTPWNPYTTDGHPAPHTGLMVIDLPITAQRKSQTLTFQIEGDGK